LEFKRVLYSYSVRYGPFVVSTINGFVDFGVPRHPGPNVGGQLGQLWRYISELVRETGQNSIMPVFAKIINHRTMNRQN
jgi:hypothetical protein